MTGSRTLARNSALNLAGQVVPMLAALVTIPILIRALGAPRFGVLTLVWAAIGYFSLFDLGLGRALTQAVAERLGARDSDEALAEVTWTALWLMTALGILGGLLLATAAPWIVRHGLNVPADLQRESLVSFYLLVATLPFVVSTAGLRGLLEAHQHFGLGTALRVPLALFTFVAPLAVLPFSARLEPIVAVLCAGRALAWIAHLVVCRRTYAYLRGGMPVTARALRPLLRAGGWMTVSNVVSPFMSYMDRFFIGAVLPLAAVAYYVTPYEVVMKLMVLPAALVGVLFPAVASAFAADRGRAALLLDRALRAVLLLMFPVLLVLMLFAREGLHAWVGAEFAAASTGVLQWLVLGVYINALAQAPFAVLQGVGRPELTAALHLAEAPLYAAALWWLAHRYGIVGVAAAWTLRAGLDLVALLALTRRVVPDPAGQGGPTLATAFATLVSLSAAAAVPGTLATKAALLVVALAAFAGIAWATVVRPGERAQLRGWLREARLRVRRPA